MALLSPRQYKLLMNLYQQVYPDHFTTLEEFCCTVANKTLNQIKPTDLTKIIKYTNDNVSMTSKQREFLDEIFRYLGIDGPEFCRSQCSMDISTLTKSQVNTIIDKIKSRYNVFVPQQIRVQNYTFSVVHEHPDYKILQQTYKYNPLKQLTVISFRDLLVCDWDNQTLTDIQTILKEFPYSFAIYKTYKGYHGYCISDTFDHRAFSTHQLMHKLGCDPWYISFTKLNGFVTRISPKSGRQEEYIEQFVGYQTTYTNQPKPELLELLKIKDTYTLHHVT